MRRFTLVTIIFLLALLLIAAIVQIRAAQGPRRFPGPGPSSRPSSTATSF
jgi:hypothetical protein